MVSKSRISIWLSSVAPTTIIYPPRHFFTVLVGVASCEQSISQVASSVSLDSADAGRGTMLTGFVSGRMHLSHHALNPKANNRIKDPSY